MAKRDGGRATLFLDVQWDKTFRPCSCFVQSSRRVSVLCREFSSCLSQTSEGKMYRVQGTQWLVLDWGLGLGLGQG